MAVSRFYRADMQWAQNNFCNQWGVRAVLLAARQSADGVEVSALAGDKCLGTCKKLGKPVSEWPILDQPREYLEFSVRQLELQ